MQTIKYKPGVSLDNLPIGEYIILFEDVDGWITPETEIIEVKPYITTKLKGIYIRRKGFLVINIDPSEAQWYFGDEGPFNSGHRIDDIPTGTYTISFTDIPCWITPQPRNITITDDSNVPDLDINYVRQKGSIQINLTNAPTGAYWSVDEEGQYQSGYILSDLDACISHVITFSDVANWDKPNNIEITVVGNKNTIIERTYKRHYGMLQVNIDEPFLAKWSLTNVGGPYNSGKKIYQLETDVQYEIVFHDVDGWIKPENINTFVLKDEVTIVNAQYIRNCPGSLQVQIDGPDTALWTWNQIDFYESDKLVILPNGVYTVLFTDVPDWTTPEIKNITIEGSETTVLKVNYIRDTGNILVKIKGAPEGGRWLLDKEYGPFSRSTITKNIITGTHEVDFTTVDKWIKPASIETQILKNETTEVEAEYQQNCLGFLIVLIKGGPTGVWHLNGKGDYIRKQPIALEAKEYDISFSTVPEWNKPEDTTAIIRNGETTVIQAEYTQADKCPGNLQVLITGADPDGVWCLLDSSTYDRGHIVYGLTEEKYTVYFSEVPGWIKPDDMVAEIYPNETTILEAEYISIYGPGDLQVNITSMDVLGVWYLDDSIAYQRGKIIYNLSNSTTYNVTFSEVPGWIKPNDMTATIIPGELTILEAEYIELKGRLQVQITGADPEGVWYLQGDQYQPYYLRGDTIEDLPVGIYEVFFTDVDGWIKPANIFAEVLANSLTTVEGIYIQMTGHLQVKIIGADPFGMWKLINTDYYPRNFILYDLPVGAYTVQFKHVAGWFTPDDMIAEIIHNEIAVITVVTGVYHKNVDDPIWPPPDDPDDPDPEYHPKLSVRMFEKIPIDTMGYLQVIIENIEEDPNWYVDNLENDWVYAPGVPISQGIWDLVDGISYSGLIDGQFEHAHSVFVEQGVKYVAFKNIVGWRKPSVQEVFIESKHTTVLRVRYEPLASSFGWLRVQPYVEEPEQRWFDVE